MRAHPKTEENGCLPSSPEPFHSIPAATVLFMGHNNLSSFHPPSVPLCLSLSFLYQSAPRPKTKVPEERDSGRWRSPRHATMPRNAAAPFASSDTANRPFEGRGHPTISQVMSLVSHGMSLGTNDKKAAALTGSTLLLYFSRTRGEPPSCVTSGFVSWHRK